MASTKYAFDLETYRYDKNGNPVRGTNSISVFADTYEEGLAKAKAQASKESNVGGYDVFQSLAGDPKYYDSNKGKYVGVVEESGRRGTFDSIRGVGDDGSLVKKSGYTYEGEAPMSFSGDLSKQYGGLKEVNGFTSEMIANDPNNKQITQADLYAQLAKAQALLNSKTGQIPTNAGQIGTPMGTPQFGSTSPSTGNVAGAFASSQSMLPSIDMKMADYERQLASAEREQERTQKGLLDFLKKSPSQTEMREDAFQDIGVNPTEYFADQKARIAEIDSLTQAYNEQVAAKDAAIATSYDKLASNSFINNQIGQIERNAAPRLNQMSANINSKAAVLQALQGNFAEARNFVNQAVEDAVADKKFQVDLFTMMYDMNQDKIDRLDKKYSEAYSYAFDLAKMEYENAREDKQKVGELLLQNPQAGISMSDSLDEAYRKIGVNPNSPERRLLEAQIANTLDNAEGGGSDDDSGTAYISIMQEAINNGATPEEAARAAARVSEEDGIPVSQSTLNSWVVQARNLSSSTGANSGPVPRQDSRSTLSYLPSSVGETVGSFFSNLFGG